MPCGANSLPRPRIVPEPLHTGGQQHHRVRHARLRAQRVLDLAQLEALPAQLHLKVDAAAKLELAVRVPAHAVARAVGDAAARGVRARPRLRGALPEDFAQQQLPQDQRRTRFTLGSIDIFTTWQGSLVYVVVITASLLALNQQQRQLAVDNTKSLTPIPLNLQQDSDALLEGLRPLEELQAGQQAETLATLSRTPSVPGVLEVTLEQPSTVTLSSEGGDRSALRGATGTLTLQLLPPLELRVQPAPAEGAVRWNGQPQRSAQNQPGTYRLDQTSARNP